MERRGLSTGWAVKRPRTSSEDLVRRAREGLRYPSSDDPSAVESVAETETEPVVEPEPLVAGEVPVVEAPEVGSDTGFGSEAPVVASTRPESPGGSDVPPLMLPPADERSWYRRRWVWFWVVLVAGGAFMSELDDRASFRDAAGEIETHARIILLDLQVGDCLMRPGEDPVGEVDVTPCDTPHEMEMYAEVVPPSSAEYEEQSIRDWSDEACYRQFGEYVGAPWEQVVDLDYFILMPSEESWLADERQVRCFVVPFGGASLPSGSVRRTVQPGEEAFGEIVAWNDVTPGMCVDIYQAYLVAPLVDDDHVQVKSCEGLHQAEVASVFPYPLSEDQTAEFLGAEVLFAWASEECQRDFPQFLQSAQVDTDIVLAVRSGEARDLFVAPMIPNWEAGDRNAVCLLGSVVGKHLTGQALRSG